MLPVRPSALLVTFLLSATVVAGCIGDTDDDKKADEAVARPAAMLRCLSGPGSGCNQEMTPDEGRTGNEVTIAVNPKDPLNIVGGAKDYYPPDAGECVWDGVYVTHDGGVTYEDRSFDGSPWRLRAGDMENYRPNYASQFWCTTDPVAYFNTNGDLYYLLMAYQADPVTGSKTGEEEIDTPCGFPCPHGALNDWAFNRATQIVAISSDGGDTFHTFTPVLEGTFPVNFHDKGWIAASHNGVVHVMWLAFFVPGNQYCRSIDEGQTYTCTEIVATQFVDAGQGSFLDVGTGGEVYASWYNGGIMIKRSDDYGETWGEATHALDTNPQSMPGLSPRDRRTGYPSMATDRSTDSPFSDSVYFVWNDKCQDAVWTEDCTEGNNSIYFSASTDKGETFSTPIRINDDVDATGNLSSENWQIFPTVSVSPGGVIDVSWMDTRLDSDGYLLDQYYTYSLDGGKTWAPNLRVRDTADQGWDPALSFHQNGMVFIGDYNDIDSSWGAAHPVWPDTRHGIADVYTAVIDRPLFAEGWSEADMERLRIELVADRLVPADHPYLEE
ncbi:MAG: glycoside hydrolase [Euryarchaeota archaeon]|nr:glycoside hydrolase [Euryarchaeota archaeon]